METELLFTVNIPRESASSVTQLMVSCRLVHHTHARTHSLSLLSCQAGLDVCACVQHSLCWIDSCMVIAGNYIKNKTNGVIWNCSFQSILTFLCTNLLTSSSNLFSLSSASSVWLICMYDICVWFFSSFIFSPHTISRKVTSYKPGPAKGFFPLKGSLSSHCRLLWLRLWVVIKHQETLWQMRYKLSN